jgi:uncharacterized membrane protein YczE
MAVPARLTKNNTPVFAIPSTSIRIITIVIVAIGLDATIGIGTLSACMLLGLKPDPSLVTAYVGITSGLTGALVGMLSNTRSQPGTDDDLPKAVVATDKPTI